MLSVVAAVVAALAVSPLMLIVARALLGVAGAGTLASVPDHGEISTPVLACRLGCHSSGNEPWLASTEVKIHGKRSFDLSIFQKLSPD
jgi:hypothetical protein